MAIRCLGRNMGRTRDSEQMRFNPIAWLRDKLMILGIEWFCKRYYGIYTAKVFDNNDPSERGKIQIFVPAFGEGSAKDAPNDRWALPCMPGLSVGDGQMHGVFFPPDINDEVMIQCLNGDPRFPVYSGGFLKLDMEGTDLVVAKALYKGIRTKTGHYLRFSDDPQDLHITIAHGDGKGDVSGSMISLDKDGSVIIANDDGAHIWLNKVEETISMMAKDGTNVMFGKDRVTAMTKSGASIDLNSKKVEIHALTDMVLACGGKLSLDAGSLFLGHGASEPAVRGLKLMQWALLHSHITPGFSAPSPPGATPPLMLYKELSETVKVA